MDQTSDQEKSNILSETVKILKEYFLPTAAAFAAGIVLTITVISIVNRNRQEMPQDSISSTLSELNL